MCTHSLSVHQFHLLIAVKPLLLVWSLIAHLISECRVTLNCLAPYTSHVLQHTQISQKQSEREWGVGESVFVVSGWHFEHSSYDWRSSLPFLFSTKQLRPSLSYRGSWESLCLSNQVVIRLNSAILHINQLLNIIVHLLLEGVIYNCEMHVVTSE